MHATHPATVAPDRVATTASTPPALHGMAVPAVPPGAAPAAATSTGAATRRDLALVLAVTLLAFVLAGSLELHEMVSRWTQRWEFWQIDEVPEALTVLAFGLAWFAFRRRAEAAAAWRLQAAAQAEALQLLAHNRELARQLISVQESERRALARELHDELGQSCNAIRVEAAYIQRASDPQLVKAAAGRAAATAEGLYQHVRSLLRQLRPAELDELGLVAALQALCESWEERSGIACIFHHDGALDDAGDLGEALDTAIYRVAQEALSNVMRHAGATRVRISLGRANDGASPGQDALTCHWLLQVVDDGGGFNPQRDTRGLGLLGASERAAALGGALHISSAPGAGTRLAMRVPCAAVPARPTESAQS
jgi:signal transduction histidine kinase